MSDSSYTVRHLGLAGVEPVIRQPLLHEVNLTLNMLKNVMLMKKENTYSFDNISTYTQTNQVKLKMRITVSVLINVISDVDVT